MYSGIFLASHHDKHLFEGGYASKELLKQYLANEAGGTSEEYSLVLVEFFNLHFKI